MMDITENCDSLNFLMYLGVACVIYKRTNEVYLPMNGVNNDWLPVEAEAHQSWPPKTKKKLTK